MKVEVFARTSGVMRLGSVRKFRATAACISVHDRLAAEIFDGGHRSRSNGCDSVWRSAGYMRLESLVEDASLRLSAACRRGRVCRGQHPPDREGGWRGRLR